MDVLIQVSVFLFLLGTCVLFSAGVFCDRHDVVNGHGHGCPHMWGSNFPHIPQTVLSFLLFAHFLSIDSFIHEWKIRVVC